jgi:hypothetical protein
MLAPTILQWGKQAGPATGIVTAEVILQTPHPAQAEQLAARPAAMAARALMVKSG